MSHTPGFDAWLGPQVTALLGLALQYSQQVPFSKLAEFAAQLPGQEFAQGSKSAPAIIACDQALAAATAAVASYRNTHPQASWRDCCQVWVAAFDADWSRSLQTDALCAALAASIEVAVSPDVPR